MKKRYCMSCGERKRLTYPKDDPTCCTMRCAAQHYEIIAETEGDDSSYAYCTCCGAYPPNECDGWEEISESEIGGWEDD